MKKTILLLCLSFFLIIRLANAQIAQLWGMTPIGGSNPVVGYNNGGVIFKIDLGGAGFDTVYSFNPDTVAGGGDFPQGDLFNAPDGKLYGTTFYGGVNSNEGTIFSFDPSKNIYTDLHNFNTTTGYQTNGSLILANDGNLYGMASVGGAHNLGVIFRFNPDSDTYKDVYDFDSIHGANPYANLLASSNGKLYGMTPFGGTHNLGILFSFDMSNNVTDLHDFDSVNGSYPGGSLVQSGNKLFGVTNSGGSNDVGVVFSYNLSNPVFTKLYDFSSDSGGIPEGSLVQIPGTGTFYGTASGGGANSDGVIFSFDTLNNTYIDVFDFAGTNGQIPSASLLFASDGNLYGTTLIGGADSDGVIFSFNPSDSDCLDLHDFNVSEGGRPDADLIEINSTGIEQLAGNKNQLMIYPNPASTQFTIISKQLLINKIEITNLIGQVIFKSALGNLGVKKIINVSSLPPGMYFVSVTSDNNQTITNKISVISR
jgi:uncharacterized repeat protein (TIGR03803 family)